MRQVRDMLLVFLCILIVPTFAGKQPDTEEGITTPSKAVHKHHRKKPCGGDRCMCSATIADCSDHEGNLSYIPKLPYRIESLIFKNNGLKQISRDDFFKNVSGIVNVHLENNELEYISPGAFRPLGRMRKLYLDNNKLNYTSIKPVFSSPVLHTLSLGFMKLGPIPDDFFAGQHLPRLEVLDLTGNDIGQLNFSVFLPLTNLKDLHVAQNRIVKTFTHSPMPYLRMLNFETNDLYDLPTSCAEDGSSLFPRLSQLLFYSNQFSQFHTNVCFPELQTLVMSKNRITVIETDMFGEERFRRLRSLALDTSPGVKKIAPFAFRNPSLQQLLLMYNSINFLDESFDSDCFAGNPNLMHLELSHNFCQGLPEARFKRLFGSLKNLQTLFLGSCDLGLITKGMLSSLSQISHLGLHGNRLSMLPPGGFDELYNLTHLDIGNNQLQTVDQNVFGSEIRGRLASLDLSGNPFSCDCDLLWFRQWFGASPALFAHSYKNYTCRNLRNTTLKDFYLKDQACLLSHETCRAVIVVVFVFTVLVLFVSTLYYYRWYIRLLLAFRGRNDVIRGRLEAGHFDYDVFVSVAEEDLPWVEQHLLPTLEDDLGVRLCVNERDFQLGKRIIDNIVDSVESSKKYLVLFSSHYGLCPWCQFELDLCLTQTLDSEDVLMVVCLGDLPARHVTSTMMAVLKTTSYVQWRGDVPQDVALFWRRMTFLLKDVIP